MKFRLDKMRQRCVASIEDYKSEGVVSKTKDGIYIFQDNGADILAVAHLDTVQRYKHFHAMEIAGDQYVFNSALDDRLGAYIILDLLPLHGVKCDVLLTEGEEVGRSTAAHFYSDKQYNWIFSFDRMGTDVVMYQYDNKESRDMVKDAHLRPGMGSFSDICDLDQLNALGFNFGTGYYNNHDKLAHANLSDTRYMVQGFLYFYRKFKDTQTTFTRKARTYKYNSLMAYSTTTTGKIDHKTKSVWGRIGANCGMCGSSSLCCSLYEGTPVCPSCMYQLTVFDDEVTGTTSETVLVECDICGDTTDDVIQTTYGGQPSNMCRACAKYMRGGSSLPWTDDMPDLF